MITFKQLEALLWITQLGSFTAAAEKLNTTQSAISKRIQELEEQFRVELFDRSKRTARLTDKGTEVLTYAKALLEDRDNFVERISSSQVLIRQFKVGVTELTALTWLPKLVGMIRTEFPRVTIEPEVELSETLFNRLMDDTIDLIIVPNVYNNSRCVTVQLEAVENAWMGVPDLHPFDEPMDLSKHTMLVQGGRSGTGLVYSRWLSDRGIQPTKTINCANLVAQIGFTLSGLGVSYLPVAPLRPLIGQGRLRVMPVATKLPRIRYAALYRVDRSSEFKSSVANFAASCCDFQTIFLQAD